MTYDSKSKVANDSCQAIAFVYNGGSCTQAAVAATPLFRLTMKIIGIVSININESHANIYLFEVKNWQFVGLQKYAKFVLFDVLSHIWYQNNQKFDHLS